LSLIADDATIAAVVWVGVGGDARAAASMLVGGAGCSIRNVATVTVTDASIVDASIVGFGVVSTARGHHYP
jgi:hypothetical protein